MQQQGFDWSRDASLPYSGRTSISRHHSAKAAQAAAETRVTKTLQYLELLKHAGDHGLTDHEAAAAMGVALRVKQFPLSSVCSIRNGAGPLVVPSPEPGVSPFGKSVTRWRHR